MIGNDNIDDCYMFYKAFEHMDFFCLIYLKVSQEKYEYTISLSVERILF